jgi:hypothetical protein
VLTGVPVVEAAEPGEGVHARRDPA